MTPTQRSRHRESARKSIAQKRLGDKPYSKGSSGEVLGTGDQNRSLYLDKKKY